MATLKKRINISVSDMVEQAVSALANRDQVPQATKVAELLELALEIEEDSYFNHVVQSRENAKTVWTDHTNAWK